MIDPQFEGVHYLRMACASEPRGRSNADQLVRAATERDATSVRDHGVERAVRLVTLKLVGYTEVMCTPVSKLTSRDSISLFGGRVYLGVTPITPVTGAISSMIRTLAVELAPVRLDAWPPGVVVDGPELVDEPAAAHEGLIAHAAQASVHDGLHHRWRNLPAREPGRQRRQPGGRLRMDAALKVAP
jgi:hypothetical protein